MTGKYEKKLKEKNKSAKEIKLKKLTDESAKIRKSHKNITSRLTTPKIVCCLACLANFFFVTRAEKTNTFAGYRTYRLPRLEA